VAGWLQIECTGGVSITFGGGGMMMGAGFLEMGMHGPGADPAWRVLASGNSRFHAKRG